jgi:hypothetical protein
VADNWKRHLERSGEPWYLLAQPQSDEPWLAENGRTTRNGCVVINLVVAYGSEPGPWVKVGTWDFGFSGPAPGRAARAEMDRDNVTDRLVLAAAAGTDGTDPAEVTRRLESARAAVAPWALTELSIDGTAHPALLSSCGEHQLVYSTATDRCVFVQSHGLPVATEIISCTDRDTLDALFRAVR